MAASLAKTGSVLRPPAVDPCNSPPPKAAPPRIARRMRFSTGSRNLAGYTASTRIDQAVYARVEFPDTTRIPVRYAKVESPTLIPPPDGCQWIIVLNPAVVRGRSNRTSLYARREYATGAEYRTGPIGGEFVNCRTPGNPWSSSTWSRWPFAHARVVGVQAVRQPRGVSTPPTGRRPRNCSPPLIKSRPPGWGAAPHEQHHQGDDASRRPITTAT